VNTLRKGDDDDNDDDDDDDDDNVSIVSVITPGRVIY
jgi:hypothetical protein